VAENQNFFTKKKTEKKESYSNKADKQKKQKETE